ncbi:uncharacterized protein LOC123720006 [Pieris brassicae]|uniref:Centriolar and ciliogenesis-associated protein HYLS1 C-terminal domain-containing protein n=1 Tax=Pieris brassicae TaxID=7116 RepID=A0A9P0TZQ4_PIEBR|nr:uncharacterized protein LOC123720006 [Pieris brassicae]CAH4037857.1 unnamed protein product [Pieris brassicae]
MDDYIDMTSHLDAREILRYLNYLGIYNISGEVLKYFITDLKKLIKYDVQHKRLSPTSSDKQEGPERLHSASTFSSRSRSKAYTGKHICCSKGLEGPRKPLSIRLVQSAPTLGQKVESKPAQRSCSCVRVEKKPGSIKESSKPSTTLSQNLIKVPKARPKKKCDPVSLYHYYSSLWEKYKPNVPGENDWSEIRWRIRQKMVQVESHPCSKIVHKAQENRHIRKENNS